MAHLSLSDGTSDEGGVLLFFLEGVAVDGPGGPGGLLYAKRLGPAWWFLTAATCRCQDAERDEGTGGLNGGKVSETVRMAARGVSSVTCGRVEKTTGVSVCVGVTWAGGV